MLRRILLVPAALGLVFGFMALNLGSASAQGYFYNGYGGYGAATVSCPGWPSATCTVTVDQPVPAGQSIEVTLPDNQTELTLNCSNGCFPNETFSITVSPSLLAGGIQEAVMPGSCVNGSFPTQYGCTSAFVSIPAVTSFAYYTMPTYTMPYLPTYVTPPTFYTTTPTYYNGYWWSWDNNAGNWNWSHHGNHWHPWQH
jgi:hypothetical protein